MNRTLIIFVVCAWTLSLAYSKSIEVEKSEVKELNDELKNLYLKLKDMGKKFENRTMNDIKKKPTQEISKKREKRQLAFAGGLGIGFGAYDYNDYYGDYVSDYAYDYYDWVCSDTLCTLCNVLTSECCDPAVDINCFLPDSCLNNPCLSGGTCITTRTIDARPDFICVCLPGLTGKYCQIVNDYFVGAEIAFAPVVAPPPMAFGPQSLITPGIGAGGVVSSVANPGAVGAIGSQGAVGAVGSSTVGAVGGVASPAVGTTGIGSQVGVNGQYGAAVGVNGPYGAAAAIPSPSMASSAYGNVAAGAADQSALSTLVPQLQQMIEENNQKITQNQQQLNQLSQQLQAQAQARSIMNQQQQQMPPMGQQPMGFDQQSMQQQMMMGQQSPMAQPMQMMPQQQQSLQQLQQLQQQQQMQQQQFQQPQSFGQTQNLALKTAETDDSAAIPKVQAIKRVKCENGQIYSAEHQKCLDFSLAKHKAQHHH